MANEEQETIPERPTIDSFMVADYAEAINGKLYITGGGWTTIAARAFPQVSFWIGGLLRVPWGDTNRRLSLKVWVESDEGEVYDWRLEGEIEAGRAPGQRGAPSILAIAAPVAFEMSEPGRVLLKLDFAGYQRSILVEVQAPGQPPR